METLKTIKYVNADINAALWDKFWTGGISNPLNAIERITFLLFMKQLDETDNLKVSNANYLMEDFKSIFSGIYLL